MAYLGDITLEDTLDFKFSTVGTTGAPTTIAGSPTLAAYVGNSTTQITAGLTLTVDFDTVTGLHNARVAATAANGYAAATNVDIVMAGTGTVGGTSITGYVVGSFSIGNRSALRPTTAGRTLDVSAGGEAGVDWANVGSPTTAVDLSGTNIKTNQKVDVETIKTQAVTAAAGVTFPASIASPTNITAATGITLTPTTGLGNQTADITGSLSGSVGSVAAGGITSSSIAADAIGASELAADAVAEIAAAVLTTQMTESYRADGAAPTLAQGICETLAHLGESSIASTTKTIKKFDGTTTAGTFTLDDATTPTSITRAT